MNLKTSLLIAIPFLGLGGYFLFGRSAPTEAEIEYRYAPVQKGEIVKSISATGQVEALTSVDVKSKAGGKVVKLAVDEGAIVHKGDLIALIDPEDTRAIVDQANADLASADARAAQARQSLELQVTQSAHDVADARAALTAARIRYQRATLQFSRQPELTRASIAQAKASYESAIADLERMEKVTIPQARRDSQVNLSQAAAQRDTAVSNLQRQEELFKKGYVSGTAQDKARSDAEAAKSAYETAKQRASTIEQEVEADLRSMQKARDRASAVYRQSVASSSDDAITKTSLEEARSNVRAAEIALQRAIDNQKQVQVKKGDVLASQAATIRDRVSLKNAQVQLDSTTVLAPRDGVVTQKYLEEGTIIPPGTSTFAQGTSLVQISDVTRLFVQCAVDEADVANVKLGQPVRITADAYRGVSLDGVVNRISPAAKTDNNVTAVKVRVEVLPGSKVHILPGMNATCEFITLQKKGVIVIPSQAIQDDGTVRVKSGNPKKPEIRKITAGETGNDVVEVVSGLKEGEEVVTAEIDMALLRETQKKMKEAEEGGGLAGGGPAGGKKKPKAVPKK